MLRRFPRSLDPNVLVGFDTSDDAGVFRVREDLALVQTVDFFTPIVDDPFDFGRIAAANALSDVYAMGGTPITALNIAAFPIDDVPGEVLARILEGGAAIAREAGVAILGGHTVKDDEPKYGMAVTGTIDPRAIVTNAGGRIGDALVLTKALGTGILANALKKDAIDEAGFAEGVASMTRLNASASRAMLAEGAHAATDVTGFGVLGHARELARASGLRARISASALPVFAGVLDLLARGIAPGGTRANAREHAAFTTVDAAVDDARRLLASDAQTSGGLLIAIDAARADALIARLHASGDRAVVIGFLEAGEGVALDP